jgi:hypothetical protein
MVGGQSLSAVLNRSISAAQPFRPPASSAGQRVLITSHATTVDPEPAYVPASTLTLLPQTIDGTVSAVSSAGGYDVYTVTLAPYDAFPQFATQDGQATLLLSPNVVTVYVSESDSATVPVSAGQVFRFTGLIFNDSGALRMACYAVNPGVAE